MLTTIVFPGQGSQNLYLLRVLFNKYKVVRTLFRTAEKVLNIKLWDMITSDEKTLYLSEISQPVILITGFALFEIYLQKENPLPDIMVGHSLGEYSALVASRAITFDSAVKLVYLRGKLMQSVSKKLDGKMNVVLNMTEESVHDICLKVVKEIGKVVEISSFNTSSQFVISGESSAISHASQYILEAGGLSKELKISVPSHCSLMKEISQEFERELEKIEISQHNVRIIHNYNADFSDLCHIKSSLLKQLYMPVMWRQSIAKLLAFNHKKIIECNYNSILSNINKRIAKQLSYNIVAHNILQYL